MSDRYSNYLAASGIETLQVAGHSWQRYQGVMIPAYLPHAVPRDIGETATLALKNSGALLARWTEDFNSQADGEWWFVIRDGVYVRQSLSSSTRSKLSRGCRRLEARPVSPAELLQKGYAVCIAASQRYGTREFLPDRITFDRRLRAAEAVDGVVEYWGVFRDDTLVGFSENHVQDQAVFMESIWYDPSGLRDYSSYVLMDAILEEYLNQRDFHYVSDRSRSIYHDTGVHDFLIEKFGYRKAKAKLRVKYRPAFESAMRMSSRALPLASKMSRIRNLKAYRRLEALMLQDRIARNY